MPRVDPRLVETFLEVAPIEGLSGRERRVADYVLGFLRGLGLDPRESEPDRAAGDDAGNVVCPVAGGGDRLLLAHLDTARPTGALRARRLEDRIASDGTTALGVDNRAGVAILLYTTEQAIRNGGPPPAFTLAFTVQEETTLKGAQTLQLDPSIHCGHVFDSALRPGHFVCRSYGARRFRAELRGRAAHSGLAPERGINAVRAAARAVAEIDQGRLDETTTANVATFHGGSAINVVPDRAVVEGEVRSLERDAVERQVAAIRACFERAAAAEGARLDFECRWDFEPYVHDSGSEVYLRVERALRAAGLESRPVTSAGGSDANVLNARGLPTVNLGIGAQNPHTDEEFILLEDLAHGAAVAGALIRG